MSVGRRRPGFRLADAADLLNVPNPLPRADLSILSTTFMLDVDELERPGGKSTLSMTPGGRRCS